MVQTPDKDYLIEFLCFHHRFFPKQPPVQCKRFIRLIYALYLSSAVFKTVCLPVPVLIFFPWILAVSFHISHLCISTKQHLDSHQRGNLVQGFNLSAPAAWSMH